jgi:hypothetical protein
MKRQRKKILKMPAEKRKEAIRSIIFRFLLTSSSRDLYF